MTNKYIEILESKNIKVRPVEEYIKDKVKIKHKCICGNIWNVTPNIVKKGSLCGCARKGSKGGTPILKSEYLNRLNNKNIKVEPIGKYVNIRTKILHKCTCGNMWNISPILVLRNVKCRKCVEYIHNESFYKNKKTILYYIKVDKLYKIGVTLFKDSVENSIYKNRFAEDIRRGINITIIDTKIFIDGSDAYLEEQKILNENKNFKYQGNKVLRTGNTELFREKLDII